MISTDLKNVIEPLQEVMWQGFYERTYIDQIEGVFRSHYDWHSSVHGHWSLLSSSRFLGNKESQRKILDRLNPTALRSERERLFRNENFELPYGQAWLLLLLHELDKNHLQHEEVNNFRAEVSERIGIWLERNEFPEHKVNSYHSWLITYFLFKKSHSDAYYPRINKIDEKFNSVNAVHDENDPKDFFSSESLFQILKFQPKKPFNLFDRLDQLGPITQSNCHHLGKIISHTWTTPKNQPNAIQSAIQLTSEILKRPQLWKSDFDTVAHWIPQFLWLGLFLALDEY